MQNGADTPNQTEQLLHFGKWGFEVINPTPAPAMVCVLCGQVRRQRSTQLLIFLPTSVVGLVPRCDQRADLDANRR